MQYPTLDLEKKLWADGKDFIVGIDEAGRGPWAGPMAVAGVLITSDTTLIEGIADSKKLSKKRRERVLLQMREEKILYEVILVENTDLDKYGLSACLSSVISKICLKLELRVGKKIDTILLDGANLKTNIDRLFIKENNADMNHYCVSCASVIAKVSRDKIMCSYAKKYPEYGFDKHMGYGTKLHQEMIDKYGPCPIHRVSFNPIKKLIEEKNNLQKKNWKYWRGDCS